MGLDGVFINGSDFLMDGGVTAACWFGELAPKRKKGGSGHRLLPARRCCRMTFNIAFRSANVGPIPVQEKAAYSEGSQDMRARVFFTATSIFNAAAIRSR